MPWLPRVLVLAIGTGHPVLGRPPQSQTVTPTKNSLILRPVRHPEFHLLDAMTALTTVFERHDETTRVVAIPSGLTRTAKRSVHQRAVLAAEEYRRAVRHPNENRSQGDRAGHPHPGRRYPEGILMRSWVIGRGSLAEICQTWTDFSITRAGRLRGTDHRNRPARRKH